VIVDKAVLDGKSRVSTNVASAHVEFGPNNHKAAVGDTERKIVSGQRLVCRERVLSDPIGIQIQRIDTVDLWRRFVDTVPETRNDAKGIANHCSLSLVHPQWIILVRILPFSHKLEAQNWEGM